MNKVMFLLELTLFISIFIIFYQILKSIKINKIKIIIIISYHLF